ncbi:MAG: tetratricopeptide repeat protein [Planctomycetota bacterium]
MTPELLKLISRVVEREQVGTLYLGRGDRVRRIFLSSREVHLLDAGKECRFLPDPSLFQSGQFSRSVLDDLAAELRRKPQSVASLLASRGILSEEQRADFAARELREEVLLVLARHGHQFLFEEGQVPEELLLPDHRRAKTGGLTLVSFVEALQQRRTELREFVSVLPSLEELLVLSEKGIRVQNEGHDWLFLQVAELIDGFRNLRSLLSDGVLFPHHTAMTLLRAVRTGLAKKTLFPEFEGIEVSQLTPLAARELVTRFEQAAEMAVDDLPIRKRLAQVCLRAGEVDSAIHQLNYLGDTMMQRGDLGAALEHYREALRWDPDLGNLRDKVVQVYADFSQEALLRGNVEAGRRLLEEALRYRPRDLDLYFAIIGSYPHFEEALQHAVPRLVRFMMRAGENDLPLVLFERLATQYPQCEAVRRRFVNLLLDRDMIPRAVQELTLLAGSLLDRGATAEAAQIYEKIAALAPAGSVDLETIRRLPARTAPRRRRWSQVGQLVIAGLLFFGTYQAYSYTKLESLDRQAAALFETSLPYPGTPEHRQFESDADLLLRRLRSFRRVHFASLFSQFAARSETVVQGRVNFLQTQLNKQLTSAFAVAERAELLGRPNDAVKQYATVEQLGKGTLWAERAKGQREKLERYLNDAEELFLTAQAVEQRGELSTAFDLYQGLLYRYPRSAAALRCRIPLRIESTPPGAQVALAGQPMGTTPLTIRVQPFEPFVLEVEQAGYQPEMRVIENPSALRVSFSLRKE